MPLWQIFRNTPDNPGGSKRTDAQASGRLEEGSTLELDAQDPILARLRLLYDDVASEPLPDDLLTLLDELDKAERKR